jgi:hypothetical protein
MKRMRRNQRRATMIGGAALASVSVVAAAAAAATTVVARKIKPNATNNTSVKESAENAGVGKDAETGKDEDAGKDAATSAGKDAATSAGKDAGDNKSGSILGVEIPGDIPIKTHTIELKKNEDAQKLLTFLVNNGLPYYIQIEMKSDGKKFNRHDTEIFDLRRILFGKFATKKDFETDGKIPEKKRDLYFKAPDQVGIADGDTMGNEHPNDVFIYTGEKGTIDPTSTDNSIKITITGSKNGPVVCIN